MKMREFACLAVFLASALVYPALVTGLEPEAHVMSADADRRTFEYQRLLIKDLFRSYENDDFPKIRSLMVIDALIDIPEFRRQIENLAPEFSVKSHRFEFEKN